MVKSGAKEIILLGQNVNAYSFEGKSKVYRLSDLINELEKFTEINDGSAYFADLNDLGSMILKDYSKNKIKKY